MLTKQRPGMITTSLMWMRWLACRAQGGVNLSWSWEARNKHLAAFHPFPSQVRTNPFPLSGLSEARRFNVHRDLLGLLQGEEVLSAWTVPWNSTMGVRLGSNRVVPVPLAEWENRAVWKAFAFWHILRIWLFQFVGTALIFGPMLDMFKVSIWHWCCQWGSGQRCFVAQEVDQGQWVLLSLKCKQQQLPKFLRK